MLRETRQTLSDAESDSISDDLNSFRSKRELKLADEQE